MCGASSAPDREKAFGHQMVIQILQSDREAALESSSSKLVFVAAWSWCKRWLLHSGGKVGARSSVMFSKFLVQFKVYGSTPLVQAKKMKGEEHKANVKLQFQ